MRRPFAPATQRACTRSASAYAGCNAWAKDANGNYKCQENPKTGAGCMYMNEDGFDDTSSPGGGFSNPVFVGRRISVLTYLCLPD